MIVVDDFVMCCVFVFVEEVVVVLEILVGVVVVDVEGCVIVEGCNICEVIYDFIGYVEIEVLCGVVVLIGFWNFEGYILVVMFELCIMCVGVIL